MNFKKLLPYIFFAVLAIIAISLRMCNSNADKPATANTRGSNTQSSESSNGNTRLKLDRNPAKFYFTKHARCRMKCRKITQKEVKEILANGTVNYNKSDLNDPKGPTYAVEGITSDRQRVRIIFAPKQRHMSVVTVIDLEVDYKCDC